MDSFPTLETLGFSARRSNHRGKWRAIYLEPMVGSGERLCIGIVAQDADRAILAGVEQLDRLACVYGEAAAAFVFASQVALRSVEKRACQDGLESLSNWTSCMDGLQFGKVQLGAGESLEDIAHTGLMQCASLQLRAQKIDEEEQGVAASARGATDHTSRRLELLVRDFAVGKRPGLEANFGKLFRVAENARPTRIGYIGTRIAANFGIVVPGHIGPLVNVAKAKLWDLSTLKSNKNDDMFPGAEQIDFELLLHSVSYDSPLYSERQLVQVEAALLALREEADKASIRCRTMYSPEEIANFLLQKEAA